MSMSLAPRAHILETSGPGAIISQVCTWDGVRELGVGKAGKAGGGWVEGRHPKDYKYLSNFKMQIPCLWSCWDQIFRYHLSGKSLREKNVTYGFSLHEVFWFGLV